MKSAKLSAGTRYYGHFKDLDWKEFFTADPLADISWQRPRWESAFPRADVEPVKNPPAEKTPTTPPRK